MPHRRNLSVDQLDKASASQRRRLKTGRGFFPFSVVAKLLNWLLYRIRRVVGVVDLLDLLVQPPPLLLHLHVDLLLLPVELPPNLPVDVLPVLFELFSNVLGDPFGRWEKEFSPLNPLMPKRHFCTSI